MNPFPSSPQPEEPTPQAQPEDGATLPPELKEYIEQVINWILPGLTLYYRDTDAPADVDALYPVGSIRRAGFFIDCSPRAQRPALPLRFLIASAHAAWLCKIPGFADENTEKWQWCTLHYNSYFKVMDVYRKEGFTQVFLLHIPVRGVALFSDEHFFGQPESFCQMLAGANGTDLISIARHSLDSKLRMPVLADTNNDALWHEKTHPLVGCNAQTGELVPQGYLNEDISISTLVRRLADDTSELNYPPGICFEEQP